MILLGVSLVVFALGAVLSLILSRRPRIALAAAVAAIVLASLLAFIASLTVLLGEAESSLSLRWSMPLGDVSLAMDGLSAWFVLTISLVSIAVALYSPAYLSGDHAAASPVLFGLLLCLLVASLHIVVCAADTVLFLFGWEAMTLCAFFLVNAHDRSDEVRQGAWMYLIATHLGTALFVLPMFGLLVSRGGSSAFASFAPALAAADDRFLTLLFLLGFVGFGTKAGFMPMHVWLPNAHPVAPTPVSALLSGVVIKTGIYAILRLLTWLPPLPLACASLMLAAGIISGVVGVLYALAQHDLKRFLAYHSVENIGIIALGIGAGMLGQKLGQPAVAIIGYAGALLHILNHALFKGLLFLSAGAVIHSTGTGAIERLGGLLKRTPVNGLLFLIAAIAICALPPLNGFVSEWLIYGAHFRAALRMAGFPAWLAVLSLAGLALMGGLALACFAKVFSVVFLGERRDDSLPAHPTPRLMLIGMAFLAGLCIAIGLLPKFAIFPAAHAAIHITRLPHPMAADLLHAGLAPAGYLTALAMLLIAIALGLTLLRGRTRAVVPVEPQATWGCGFAAPTPRMQYTASSFAWSLIVSFRGLLWPDRHLHDPAGPFPATTHLESHAPDIAESDVFVPFFRFFARLARAAQTLTWSAAPVPSPAPRGRVGPVRLLAAQILAAMRRGSIQICLTYIVLALLIVFVVEATSPRRDGARQPHNPPAEAVSDAGRISR